MKRKIFSLLLCVVLAMLSLTACAGEVNLEEFIAENDIDLSEINIDDIPEKFITPEIEALLEPTEAPHEHAYTEDVTVEATCETDGKKTFTCECGDSYTEVIAATGHVFNYVYNEDATYLADGTETAECTNCDATDTRVAEGTMLTYTYTDMSATKYAKQTVNVRDLPSTDGKKVGSLSTNDEITITGQCNETGWYRFEYNGQTAYVSNSYLSDNKVAQSSSGGGSGSSGSSGSSSSSNCPLDGYPVGEWVDMGDWMFYINNAIHCPSSEVTDSAMSTLQARYPDMNVDWWGTQVMSRTQHVTYASVFPVPKACDDFGTAVYNYAVSTWKY